jgi:putative aldouronate transport system substrate-binding protein
MLAPGYVDAIKYCNKLYHEGLIEPEFATIARLPLVEKFWNGKVGAWQAGASGISTNWVSRYTDNPKPKFVYTAIKGPNGKGGFLKIHREDSGSYTVINKKAKNPAAAMQMINYLTSLKGDTLVYFGMEGTHYKYVNGVFQTIPPFDDAVKLRNDGGFMYTELVNRQNALQFELATEETKRGNKVAEENTIDEIYLYETPKVEVDKGSVMKDMEEEFRAKAISGKSSDIDRLYETFKTNYLKEGGSEWIKQATKIYEDQKANKK